MTETESTVGKLNVEQYLCIEADGWMDGCMRTRVYKVVKPLCP